MNCREFRRRLMQDPNDSDPALDAHAAQCNPCAREAERVRSLDDLLRKVLLEASEGGETAVLPANRVRRRLLLLLAGVVLLPMVITGWWLAGTGPRMNIRALADVAQQHIAAEPEKRFPTRRMPDAAGVARSLLRDFGADSRLSALLEDNPPLYAGRCRIGKGPCAHLVLAHGTAPVTLLLISGQADGAQRTLHRDEESLLVAPMHGFAAVLVGASESDLAAMAAPLLANRVRAP